MCSWNESCITLASKFKTHTVKLAHTGSSAKVNTFYYMIMQGCNTARASVREVRGGEMRWRKQQTENTKNCFKMKKQRD
jgi:hypothetical protein